MNGDMLEHLRRGDDLPVEDPEVIDTAAIVADLRGRAARLALADHAIAFEAGASAAAFAILTALGRYDEARAVSAAFPATGLDILMPK